MDYGQNSMITNACGIARKLFTVNERGIFIKNRDKKSNGHVVKKCLRCDISSCFDMGNICCKECSIKNCRYKCNFADKENCEHKYIE